MGDIIDLGKILKDDEDLQRYLNQFWDEIVGPLLAHKTIPGGVRNGVLKVVVPNDAWSEEMALARHFLLEKITGAIGEAGKIRDICFVVPDGNDIHVGNGA